MTGRIRKRIGTRSGVLYWYIVIGQVQQSFLGIKYWSDYIHFDNWEDAEKWLKTPEYWE